MGERTKVCSAAPATEEKEAQAKGRSHRWLKFRVDRGWRGNLALQPVTSPVRRNPHICCSIRCSKTAGISSQRPPAPPSPLPTATHRHRHSPHPRTQNKPTTWEGFRNTAPNPHEDAQMNAMPKAGSNANASGGEHRIGSRGARRANEISAGACDRAWRGNANHQN